MACIILFQLIWGGQCLNMSFLEQSILYESYTGPSMPIDILLLVNNWHIIVLFELKQLTILLAPSMVVTQ